MEYSRTKIKYNGQEILISGLFESDHIFKHLNIVGNFYELKLLEKVKSLNLNGSYIDVGANIGNHSVFFSKFCNSKKVISIELDEKIYNVLNENVKNLNNVTTMNIGVGEKFKKVKISDIDKTNVGMTKIVGDDGDIIVDTLDNLLKDIDDISLIKIDVEGYEKNVLLGAKNIITKHSPVIIAELRDGREFDEFFSIMSEMGYETDKINYASTPTYFFHKKKDMYDFVYIIPSYNRFDKIKNLIQDILSKNQNTLVIVLNDGSTDIQYKTLQNLSNKIVYLENVKNNGKDGFWLTVNTLMDEMSKYKFKYGVMMGDDFTLIDGYQEKLESYISQDHLVRLFTQQNIGETNWGFKNWIDGAFCAPRLFFEKISFELFPIKHSGKIVSSGVGLQMSERLTKLGFVVKNYGSLIDHIGNDDSKMHPTLRKQQPLITNFNSIPTLTISIIIPTYGNPEFLVECLDSVINSIKQLPCEILVGIDDCKKTIEFIKNKTFDSRIKFFKFNKNVGPYVIKNSLSLIANFDYIIFFDSDDIMKEEFIQFVLNEKLKYSLLKPKYLDFTDKINPTIKTSRTYGEGVFAIDKKLFLEFNGFEGWKCAADSELMGRLYKNKVKLTHSKEICFYRRVHPESLTMHHETGMKSKMRHEYTKLMKTKKKFGPLPFLNKSEFEEVSVTKDDKSEFKEFELIKLKNDNLIKEINLNPLKKDEKKIDYNQINQILEKKGIYNPKKNIKSEIVTQTKPDPIIPSQNSINKLKQEMFPKKPNRRGESPNVFGNNQRRKGGFSI